MVNFLALLGWSPGERRELFTRDELVARFTLEGISGGNAVFNPGQARLVQPAAHHAALARRLASRVQPLIEEAGLWRDALSAAERDWFLRVLGLLQPRAKKLGSSSKTGGRSSRMR